MNQGAYSSSSSTDGNNNALRANAADVDTPEFDSESWITTPTSSAPPSYISDAESFDDGASFVSTTSTLVGAARRPAGLSSSTLVHLRPPPPSTPSVSSVVREYPVIRYIFTPTCPVSNSLTLIPPPDMPDTVPRFHIAVTSNVFNPLSYITTVYQGETQFGQWVGSFEMGISGCLSRVRMHKQDVPVINVLGKRGSRTSAVWTWKPLSSRVNNGLPWKWDYRATHGAGVCRSTDADKTLLATFIPSPTAGRSYSPGVVQVNSRGEETPLPALQVTLEGQKFFEDILISLLVIERKRMHPTDDQHTKLIFN
ncbi:hypothetical protein NLJ89_g4863 [Agrocybe chaxingu]|uniref:Uncharacterized protein n=1 Tax=Agrocybe chaxingu TaxID=84603 RepID=A0A9W8K1S6_9AGAR|nr:hypothetical protein NLJ89_g4863 [Agrocybe chaxingu]